MRPSPWKVLGLVLGLVALVWLCLAPSALHGYEGQGSRPAFAAGVTLLMAIWWLSEALPIHWTACVPLFAFPLLGVFPGSRLDGVARTLSPYVNPYIFLFLGGMCIAASMQQWNLHRRIALTIMKAIGTEPRRLLAGMLIATAVVSMWISNTATATMMVPIGVAVISQLEARSGGKRLKFFGAALMLAIAYAANVGGLGTKIGTAPNAQFAGFVADRGYDIGFLSFMGVGAGFAALFLPLIWIVLWRLGRKDAPRADVGAAVLKDEMQKLGAMSRGERTVLVVFVATALFWIASKPLTHLLQPLFVDHGFALRSAHVEGGIAMLATFLLLVKKTGERRTLELGSLRLVPWSTLLLLGGSFAMAAGVQASGLSSFLAQRMTALAELPPLAQILGASAATVGMSAVASNTATIAVMLNVLEGAIPSEQLFRVLFAATLASSCDFALPAGTPPNAIVFGSGYIRVPLMARTGILLDGLAAVLVAVWCWITVQSGF